MIKIIEGNILDAKEDIIAHQVNCMGVMGAGLAKKLRDKYDGLEKQYKQYILNYVEFNRSELLGNCMLFRVSEKRTIANLFGQLNYGRDKRYTDYDALKSSLIKLYSFAKYNNKTIAIPYEIGCGLAGGNWNVVQNIIEEVFNDYDVVLYKLNNV